MCINNNIKMNGDTKMELGHGIQGSKLLVARGGVGIGIAPLELVTCSHVFSLQLPLNQTCKLSSPNRLCALRRIIHYTSKCCRVLASVDPYDSGITIWIYVGTELPLPVRRVFAV